MEPETQVPKEIDPALFVYIHFLSMYIHVSKILGPTC